jgi:hypothetical protein
MEKLLNEYYLECRYDSRASFYGKAVVKVYENKKILYSYNTMVAYIENGKATIEGFYSQTTTRHIKEFLKQNGFYADSKKQMMKDYFII